MRLCGLRAALTATPEANQWVLHDPRAWLGTAFHHVMSAARAGLDQQNLQSAWETAIVDAARKASAHPLDRRYSLPERWPSYFLIRQRALSLASEVVVRRGESKLKSPGMQPHSVPTGAERWLEARGGRLAGRPDYYDGRTVIDYKSSLPDPKWPGAPAVIEGFQRQLRLYAAIIAEALGKLPEAARIVTASGQTMDVPIPAGACEAEADAAIASLDGLDSKFRSHVGPAGMAQPSTMSCGGCPFKLICPVFWLSALQWKVFWTLPGSCLGSFIPSAGDVALRCGSRLFRRLAVRVENAALWRLRLCRVRSNDGSRAARGTSARRKRRSSSDQVSTEKE
jgi:PD-(D/E)XK nuclease superfamily